VSESAVHAIKENYTDLTVLISRDDQGSGEMGWSEQFVNKIRQPCITAPPDVFASDSQVSIRSIYPASMRFWAAQIRKSDVTWKILVQDQETEQKTMKYRDGLVAYLQECIKGSRSNFQHLNRNGRCSDCAEERPEALKSNAAISARVLVYAPKVLLTHSVSAVIEFHEAVGIPLFYVPDFYLRALSASDAMWGDHWSKVTQLCDLFAKMQSHWRAKGVSSWNACFEMLPKNPKDLLPLWRGAGDDVVIIDDTAWQGYPGTKDNNPPAGRDPLPVLQKFLFILGLPHVLLASHAREIVSRCQPFESQEMDSLNKWWIRGSNAGIAGVD
jgi:hypothetical protein